MDLLAILVVSCVFIVQLSNAYETLTAINCGGGEFIDSNGILYEADPLEGQTGTSSDFGKQLSIGRVNEHDEPLYQTERYHTDSFHYDIPLTEGDGEYALTLKFSEVYFNNVNQKVFDVVLNSAHTIVEKLDIFKKVGKGVAHDETIYFTVSRGMLQHESDESRIRNGKVRLEFVKSGYDNPKINAIVLFRGKTKSELDQIPKLQSLDEYFDGMLKERMHTYEPDEETMRNIREEAKQEVPKVRKTSGPKQQNPYALDDSTTMLPIFIAIGAFVPLLICLCKM